MDAETTKVNTGSQDGGIASNGTADNGGQGADTTQGGATQPQDQGAGQKAPGQADSLLAGGDAKGGEFLASLPEALRGHEALKDVKDVAGLAQAFADLHAKLPKVPEAPDKYELTLPEGIKPDEAAMNGFKGLAHKLGLGNEAAQALLEFDVQRNMAQVKAFNDGLQAQEEAIRKDWGQKLDEKIEGINQMIRRFSASPQEAEAFKTWMNNTGLGSYAPLLRFLDNVRGKFSEDTFVEGNGGGSGGSKTLAQTLYPE
jgi:hypothetical protein